MDPMVQLIQLVERAYTIVGVCAVIGWVVSIVLGFSQGDKKGAPLWGGFLGCIFGPIGVIIVCLADFGPPSPVRKITPPPNPAPKPYRGTTETLPGGSVPDEWLR